MNNPAEARAQEEMDELLRTMAIKGMRILSVRQFGPTSELVLRLVTKLAELDLRLSTLTAERDILQVDIEHFKIKWGDLLPVGANGDIDDILTHAGRSKADDNGG